ncbi:MAG: CBS domain-containing protein [Acidobacteriota bacterium]|nr:CBS domain-containing protein [Acidobacteriota bacterium]
MRAADIMNRDVICVPEDMDVRDLTKLFLEKSITGAPVVDANGDLQGVISQTDLMYYSLTRDDELKMQSDFYQTTKVEGRHLPQGFQIEDVNTSRVGDVMTPVVYSVTENATVEFVSKMMTRNHIHRVIVRNGRKVTGIISALDLLQIVEIPGNSSKRPRKKNAAAVART